MKVLSFGSLNLDKVCQVAHIVRPGETLPIDATETHFGGKGLNQSVALARAGAEVWHAGKIGTDGAALAAYLRASGVNTQLLATDAAVPTGYAIIQISAENGQNSILLNRGANGAVDRAFAQDVVSHFGPGDWAVFQNEISSNEYAIHLCRERGLTVAFNPSPMTPALAASDVFRDVDVLFVNETEGAAMAGETEPEAICSAIRARYPACTVVLTLGEKGALVCDGSGFARHAAYRCKAVDTTGAGDTFSGYYLAAAAAGMDAAAALELASKAAALAVQKPGAAEAIPTRAEVEAFTGAEA